VPGSRSATVLSFYEQLAEAYHLLFEDWRVQVVDQGRILDRLLRRIVGDTSLSILDCACGIGTQAIGLALQGHVVTGTDLSPAAVRRARREAAGFGVEIPFEVASFTALDDRISGSYDVVLACDNALPHLIEDEAYRRAAGGMFAKTRPGGALLVSTRDYDRLQAEQPSFTPPRLLEGSAGRRIVMQVWSWHESGTTYDFDLLILQRQPEGWMTSTYTGCYRALRRRELEGFLRGAGYSGLRWYDPEESGYYQPILFARNAGPYE
jgi:SAM-dependent methyltransferase